MTRIEKMLYEAKILDVQTREYRPCVLVEMTDTGKWEISGCNQQFDTEEQAVKFFQEQAAGRPVGVVICDIPHILPNRDYIDTCGIQEADAMKELINHAGKGAS